MNKGFTLIELTVAILLFTVFAVSYNGALRASVTAVEKAAGNDRETRASSNCLEGTRSQSFDALSSTASYSVSAIDADTKLIVTSSGARPLYLVRSRYD